ncbi:MAG: inositol monophosphatase [Alphaproteobacteria bacterium]|nr:inositol monophosphatase [Alphaproteobacteria bacterium]MBP7757658.1 inositol monophosphatase [Alphaproteobacteria bacterium]MBP7761142.1 inositol monophosphatase [Alphaproteobacteria bacterium]MBP7904789.1 inositol monophosphatase [Alphaproteobacteria bacterium]
MPSHSALMNVMLRASEKAARSLIRDFNEVENLQVSMKGPGDFVSAADRRAEEIIFTELKKARPDYAFLMEESGAIEGNGADAEYRWLIDPLDGTTNFLHGLPHWAISIGLEHKGEVIAGLIHDPVKDEIFHAEKGSGAFMRRRRLRVSGRQDLMLATIATGAPRRSAESRTQFMKEYSAMIAVAPGLRRFGAAALDLAYVAAGRYEGFWERNLKPWDVAAGAIIVKESGGYIGDLDSSAANPVETGNVIAANDRLFEPMAKILKAA